MTPTRRLAIVALAASPLLLTGCKTEPAAARTTEVPITVCANECAQRVTFWENEVRRLAEQLEHIEENQKRFQMDRPQQAIPLTMQTARDQTVALLLRAQTNLQDARLAAALAKAG